MFRHSDQVIVSKQANLRRTQSYPFAVVAECSIATDNESSLLVVRLFLVNSRFRSESHFCRSATVPSQGSKDVLHAEWFDDAKGNAE